jgi:hypothetical protein
VSSTVEPSPVKERAAPAIVTIRPMTFAFTMCWWAMSVPEVNRWTSSGYAALVRIGTLMQTPTASRRTSVKSGHSTS